MRFATPLFTLSLALCAATAQAQPDITPQQAPPEFAAQAPVTVLPGAPALVFIAPRAGTPQEQIKADLITFVQNLNKNEAFMSNNVLIYSVNAGYFGANQWAKNWKALNIQIKLDDIEFDTVEGKQATVTIRYHAQSGVDALNQIFNARANRGAVEGMVETLALRKEAMWGEEHWQIVPPEKLNPADPEIGVFAYVTYVLAQKGAVPTDALPYVFNTEGNQSIQNLKQLSLGVMQLTQDYDEIYAFQPQYMREAVIPYVKSEQIFHIPATQQSYTFNANLSGRNLMELPDLIKTVLLYEGENQQPVLRYDGKAAIAFADGHVVLVGPEDLKNLVWDVPPRQPNQPLAR